MLMITRLILQSSIKLGIAFKKQWRYRDYGNKYSAFRLSTNIHHPKPSGESEPNAGRAIRLSWVCRSGPTRSSYGTDRNITRLGILIGQYCTKFKQGTANIACGHDVKTCSLAYREHLKIHISFQLMEQLAIPPSCQKTATKWLIMLRCVKNFLLTYISYAARQNEVSVSG